MSDEALQLCEQASEELSRRFQARHIRTRVHEARQAPHLAGMRWPFELLQNALDAGPRSGRDNVTVTLRCEPGRFIFRHDGAPFTARELIALLSGGSSKEFESDETTGRFGTGFLVTHVLAEHTSLEGLLAVKTGHERFRLSLDRSGDENDILRNIERCNQSIREAAPVESIDEAPSALIEYPVDDDGTLGLGVEAFTSALPFLFGTCCRLGQVTIHRDGVSSEVWVPEDLIRTELESGLVDDRAIRLHRDEGDRDYRILRFASREQGLASALTLLVLVDGRWEVLLPRDTAPRIYRQYPLRASNFIPISFVFDGRFESDQERSRVLMSDSDKEALSEAFEAATIATSHAFAEEWKNAHLLARTMPPATAFDPDDADEKRWWRDALSQFARRVADLPLVRTTTGMLPASDSHDRHADFIFPRLSEASTVDETAVDRMWDLLDGATDLYPPVQELSVDWSATAEGWKALGVRLNRVTAQVLAEHVREDARTVADLRIDGDPHEWLALLIDVVGECWKTRSGIDTSCAGGLAPESEGRTLLSQ